MLTIQMIKRLVLSSILTFTVCQITNAQNVGGNGANRVGGTNVNAGQPIDISGALQDTNFTTVRNNYAAPSNVLGTYYGNPFFSGRVGSTGITPGNYTGGFGQVLYSTGTTGGTGGVGGAGRVGGQAGTTGATGITGFSSTGTGATGFGGTGGTGATGGFGQFGAGGGAQNQFGAGGRANAGGAAGQNTSYVVQGDRSVGVLVGTNPSLGVNKTFSTLATKSQSDLRELFSKTKALSATPINIEVTESGVALLTGQVKTLEDKKLANGLALISPGVFRVINDIKVENP